MKIQNKVIAGLFVILMGSSSAYAQGVPVIDQTNILKSIDQLNVMIKDAGIQTDLLDQAKKHLDNLKQQLSQLQDIYKQFSGLRNIAGLELPGELNGLLKGDMNGVLTTFLSGANGDWSNLTAGKSSAMQATIEKSLKSAGLSQNALQQWSSSNVPVQQRTAQQAAAGATLAATAEQSYKEAGQSLVRVNKILDETKNSDDIKSSIDNNTRMLAELSIQLAKSLEISSVEAAYNGQGGVITAAERAEERKFFTFGNE
ncbi:type IV secretion system protein [Brucella intermedia]|uniref:type IV secretion system protein n=1 Tax=Brucella intermedia TaxID=94625 RepID=UPI00235FDB84|nr:type IV secretion system protein [Brucella intermedia]